MFAVMLRIVIPADVEPRPAIKATRLDMGDVVRDKIVSEAIAFVYRAPEFACRRINRQPDRIADSRTVCPYEFAIGCVFENKISNMNISCEYIMRLVGAQGEG
jgi:hypothetical protein